MKTSGVGHPHKPVKVTSSSVSRKLVETSEIIDDLQRGFFNPSFVQILPAEERSLHKYKRITSNPQVQNTFRSRLS